MNAQTNITAEPDMLSLFKALPIEAQHKFLQLAIDEMELDGPAEKTADLFLADAAWQICEGNEDRSDDLYPFGSRDRDTWLRHKAACAKAVVYYERCIAGRSAMLAPVLRVSPSSVVA